MDLNPYLQQLREDLLTTAALGDDATQRAAAMLASSLEPATRLAMMNALADFAATVTGLLGDTTVEARLDGRDVKVSVTRHENASTAWNGPNHTAGGTEAPFESHDEAFRDGLGRAVQDAGGELSRTTLRLINELKSKAEAAATDQGVSLNTYISRAVAESLHSKHRSGHGRGSQSVNGFIQG